MQNVSCAIIKLGFTDSEGGPAHACCGSTALALTNHDKGEMKTPCHGRAKCTAAGL